MTDRITEKQFAESAGVEDWRVVGEGACAFFRTGSFEDGVRLVHAFGDEVAGRQPVPDLDLRPDGVTVRLITVSDDFYGLSEAYVDLARRLSAVARTLGAAADPSAVQTVQVTIDARSIPDVVPFWRAVLGYVDRDDGGEDLIDPLRRGAPFWFQQMEEPRTERNRFHIDLWVPYDQAEARIAAALEAGGRLVSDEHAPHWWTLADPEGNEVDVATTASRG